MKAKEFIGEALGTFILVLFGCGSVAVAVLFGEYNSIFQIGFVWGIGVTLGIYLTRHLSNAHLNPAVTLAMVFSKRMKAGKIPVYLSAQFFGAFLAGLAVFLLFSPSIAAYESLHQITRGTDASVITAKMFGEFYPNPGGNAVVPMWLAIAAEAFGTFLLVLTIFGLTDGDNAGSPGSTITPLFIGLTVSSVIWLIAPLTQAGLNPARDFGPRVVAWITGWGGAAFPDKYGGFFWVYILAPVAGGGVAAMLEPFMKRITSKDSTKEYEPYKIKEMKSTRIIFVGGFLGAGKTTLLWEAAQRLVKKNLQVGLITNDQAPELADTVLLSHQGLKVAEVSGSCFCCNFNGLTDAIRQVRRESLADVIIAEPVGSCTDLSATILQPLKQDRSRELIIAPLSVLADPARLLPILDGETAELHIDAAYIFRKQLEESDIILITKTDNLEKGALDTLIERTRKAFPFATVLGISAVTGEGVDEWIEEVLKRTDAGLRITEVDYDIYAHGEAVLGWLNGTVQIKSETEADWDTFTSGFLTALGQRLDSAGYGVGHVKAILENGERFVIGNLTGKTGTLSVRGSAGLGKTAKLTINARVETNPENLNALVRETLKTFTQDLYDTRIAAWRCLQPGRPNPTHRFTQVVSASS
jgi:MIP family channel proteins